LSGVKSRAGHGLVATGVLGTDVAQRGDSCFLANVHAEVASASQQEIIEKAAFYRQLAILSGWKINNDFVTVDGDELD
jgi:hypothetical protein